MCEKYRSRLKIYQTGIRYDNANQKKGGLTRY
jgi:hypothetical protein